VVYQDPLRGQFLLLSQTEGLGVFGVLQFLLHSSCNGLVVVVVVAVIREWFRGVARAVAETVVVAIAVLGAALVFAV